MDRVRRLLKLSIEATKKLLRPLDYLWIKHDHMAIYSFFIPMVLATAVIVLFWKLPAPVPLIIDGGIVPAITGLLQILTGFYIGSLAAVSTFGRPSMDKPMLGSTPLLIVRHNGKNIQEELTRRRFLSLLFGYLSFLSLVLYIIGATANIIEENTRLIVPANWMLFLTWSLFGIYFFVFCNLIITTLLGLYYMTDRIHRD